MSSINVLPELNRRYSTFIHHFIIAPSFSFLSIATLLATSQALTYDYVIIGGGTSSLVVAHRLSELPNVTVAVIEAGASVVYNINVTDVGGYGNAFGTAIDWAYQSTNQTSGGGWVQTLRAGKAVGGTRMAYARAEDVQVDVWQTLGNDGWNWTTLLPYYMKSEQFQTPKPFQIADGITYNPAFHGTSEPLKVGYLNGIINGTVGPTFNETMTSVGVTWNNDMNGGIMAGFLSPPRTIDQAANIREDAGRAYYWPIVNRTNLVLYQNTYASKLVWKSCCDDVVANGVEVVTSNGTTTTISANKEVTTSAGALRSSLILELSGIGNPDILEKYNIPVAVDLPTVGENLQDQTNKGLIFGDVNTVTGSDGFIAYLTVEDLFPGNLTSLATSVQSSLSSYAIKVANASNNVVSANDLLTLFKLQYDLIFNTTTPLLELFITASGSVFDFEYWSLLPFSRGNIHITSANASAAASINPNYFMLDFDTDVQVTGAKFVRKAMGTQPLNGQNTGETSPGLHALPANATDAQIATFVKNGFRSNFHPVGTTAMMAREMGGVVDSRLKVYGTKNVRVVDAGVLPFQVCGHLTSTLYAVAEKAADLIKTEDGEDSPYALSIVI
ncbi:hypothetical protein G7Y89_g11852 [Cudoniella acicularis]|uniref:Glucose-methanol-choline oxidoreductase N-terminal domain-containing protein n=1 Tax=Cudoniella acicularis TaxID=354080 RepID=A0A8H4VXX8_9HELO|nr:hypothetical protein G7Y89_g11852 [Cudoniella acicularis]